MTADRDRMADVVNQHPIGAFNGTQAACDCDRTWRTNAEHRAHIADVLIAAGFGDVAAVTAKWEKDTRALVVDQCFDVAVLRAERDALAAKVAEIIPTDH